MGFIELKTFTTIFTNKTDKNKKNVFEINSKHMHFQNLLNNIPHRSNFYNLKSLLLVFLNTF